MFSSQVPPTSPFFSNTVTSTPAWRRRCAETRPDAPAPMTAQRKLPPTSSSRHDGARGSEPGSASSSTRKVSQAPVDCGPTRKSRTRRSSSAVSSWSGAPDAARACSASPARRRASASCSGPRPRPGMKSCAWSGAHSSRSNERSPVTCATAHRSGCTSAAARTSSSPAGSRPPQVVSVAATPSMTRSLRRRRGPPGHAPSLSGPCAGPAGSSGCSPRRSAAGCRSPRPGSPPSSGLRSPRSRRSTTPRKCRPSPRTR